MEASAPPGDPWAQGAEGDVCLASLPESLLANAVWPAERVVEGLCVGSKGLTRALLAAPRLDLGHRSIVLGPHGAAAFAGTLRAMTDLRELDVSFSGLKSEGGKALGPSLPTSLHKLVLRKSELGADGLTGASGPWLDRLEGLQELNLEWNNLGSVGATTLGASIKHLTDLRVLSLGWNWIKPDGVESLCAPMQHLHNLQELLLCGNTLGEAGVEALGQFLSRMPKLQVLDLRSNGIGPLSGEGFGDSLRILTRLHTLSLGSNKFGATTALGQALQHLTGLRVLSLEGNGLRGDGLHGLMPLRNLTNLEVLNLSRNELGMHPSAEDLCDVGRDLGMLLKPLTRLQKLFIGLNFLQAHGLRGLLPLQACANLEALTTDYNWLGGADGGHVVGDVIANLTGLRTLSMGDNGFGVEGAKRFGPSFALLCNLRDLNLCLNKLQAEGMKALEFRHLRRLRHLDLSSNQLGAEGGAILGRLFQQGTCTGLQTLNIASNDFGVEGGLALGTSLQHIRGLETLNLRANELRSEGGGALKPSLLLLTNLKVLDISDNCIAAASAQEIGALLSHVDQLLLDQRRD